MLSLERSVCLSFGRFIDENRSGYFQIESSIFEATRHFWIELSSDRHLFICRKVLVRKLRFNESATKPHGQC